MRKGKLYFDYYRMCARRRPMVAEPWDMLMAAIIFAVIAGVIFWIAGA
jgi:hypothetical protein